MDNYYRDFKFSRDDGTKKSYLEMILFFANKFNWETEDKKNTYLDNNLIVQIGGTSSFGEENGFGGFAEYVGGTWYISKDKIYPTEDRNLYRYIIKHLAERFGFIYNIRYIDSRSKLSVEYRGEIVYNGEAHINSISELEFNSIYHIYKNWMKYKFLESCLK